ncbi:MAG: M24 family metallopeptidase [Terriglobia bacterium]
MRQALRAAELDALVCCLPENIVLLTGHWLKNNFGFVVFTATGEIGLIVAEPEEEHLGTHWATHVTLFPWGAWDGPPPVDSVSKLLPELAGSCGVTDGRLGFEGSFEAVAPGYNAAEAISFSRKTETLLQSALPKARWSDATDLLEDQRAQKTPYEIERLRLANEVAGLGLETFHEVATPGRSEAEVAAAVEATIYGQGTGYRGQVRHARGWAQVMSGLNTARAWAPSDFSTSRKLAAGDLVLIELATVADGYWSDLTRMHVVGPPNERQREILEIVQQAHQAGVAACRAGSEAGSVDQAARQVIEDRGYGKSFPHFTGHGVGFRYHENKPILSPQNQEPLKPGMVVTVEPGIYLDNLGGIRLESNVLATAAGGERLDRLP